MSKVVVSEFIDKVVNAVHADELVKITLSKSIHKSEALRNIYIKLVEIKGRKMLSFTFRYATKDEVKNHTLEETIAFLELWLGVDFLNGDLLTATGDCSIQFNKKRKAKIFNKKASTREIPTLSHDKKKRRYIQADNLYLKEMGIASQEGKILKSGQKKFKQINKYIEIIDGLIRNFKEGSVVKIVDMGSGKGYLTFALYDYLKNERKLKPEIWGIELRENLVEFCNDLARRCEFDQLNFLAKDIHAFDIEELDMLIALHACDIATDVAIAKGVKAAAKIIVVAPCCHKQVRKDMEVNGNMVSILRHGILAERQAELLTDGIRSLLMEWKGYRTKVFEFIGLDNTGKNLMIVGEQAEPDFGAKETAEQLKKEFGIKRHYLEELLS